MTLRQQALTILGAAVLGWIVGVILVMGLCASFAAVWNLIHGR